MEQSFDKSAGRPRQRQKRFHHKVRTGCDTCRTRRVKCDENRPQCQNCVRSSKVCEGNSYGLNRKAPQVDNDQSWHVICATNTLPALVVGGRADPFDTYSIGPSPVIHQKIFDHAIHCQWPLFATTQQQADLAVVKKNVMTPIINQPVAYYTFLYSGACHAMFWSGQPIHHAELLRHKNQALQAMRVAIQREGSNLSDETLFCMVLLAAHGAANKFRRRKLGEVQSRKSLMFTLDAEFYCALEIEQQHMEVFYDMMRRRDNRAILLGPLWNATVLFDIFNAYMHLRRPQLPPLLPIDFCPHIRTWIPDLISLQLTERANQEFAKVSTYMPATLLQPILDGLVSVVADIDHYKRTKTPHIGSVILARSMYIRELLLLPETLEASVLETCTYKMCRISCLLSLQVWLFADTGPARNLPRRLVSLLLPILDQSLTIVLYKKLPEFYLWVVFMGLMLAYEDLDNTGDSDAMRMMVRYLDVLIVKPTPAAWTTIQHVVSRFLWCEEDCSVTAREAWNLACRMYTDGTAMSLSECHNLPSTGLTPIPIRVANVVQN